MGSVSTRQRVGLLVGLLLGLPGGASDGQLEAVRRALADEGMWTLSAPPLQQWQQKHQFAPSEKWLQNVQRAAVRLSDGGSASLVSADGLLLTNHHVARNQIHKLSTPQRDLIRDGFYARTREAELPCPDLEAKLLWSLSDVTAQVQGAVKASDSPANQASARKAAIANLEKEAAAQSGLVAEVVTLYGGGQYMLHLYRRYTDVRLVFAPEEQAAAFGGDYDNFTYPRFALDFALLRIYDGNKPLRPEHFLQLSEQPVAAGELTLVVGHPGTTSRGLTMAQLGYQRDLANPLQLSSLQARRAALMAYSARGEEQARRASALRLGLENTIKRLIGQQAGLSDPKNFARKQQDERELQQKVAARPDLKAAYSDAWTRLASAYKLLPNYSKRLQYSTLAPSRLAQLALHLHRLPDELRKPSGQRLEEYRDSRLPQLRQHLLSPSPIHLDLEEAVLADWLQQAKTALSDKDPFVQAALGGLSPAEAAHRAIAATTLTSVATRQALLDATPEQLRQSHDPLIELARRVDPVLQKLRTFYDQNVASVETLCAERIAKARFAIYGSAVYPDATFTLRISAGIVSGYEKDTRLVPHQTLFYGLFDRALSFGEKPPYQLAPKLAAGRLRFDASTPLNFVYTADTIGGNSGSPVLNRAGQVVGLNFDSNLEKLANRYFYVPDEAGSRAVAVHSVAILAALRHLYDAAPLADELLGRSQPPKATPAATTTPSKPHAS